LGWFNSGLAITNPDGQIRISVRPDLVTAQKGPPSGGRKNKGKTENQNPDHEVLTSGLTRLVNQSRCIADYVSAPVTLPSKQQYPSVRGESNWITEIDLVWEKIPAVLNLSVTMCRYPKMQVFLE
jgi:hypothetical protein